jgi:nicotinamide-nucleotide amidase
MSSQLAQRIIELLTARGETLAVVESCTGGQLSATLTAIPGASAAYLGGIVAYSNAVKSSVAGVAQALLEEHGAVSPECARALAEQGRRVLGADWCVAVTGIAGPGGGTPAKPVGLVYFGYAGPGGVKVEEQHFDGERANVQQRSVGRALAVLKSLLE